MKASLKITVIIVWACLMLTCDKDEIDPEITVQAFVAQLQLLNSTQCIPPEGVASDLLGDIFTITVPYSANEGARITRVLVSSKNADGQFFAVEEFTNFLDTGEAVVFEICIYFLENGCEILDLEIQLSAGEVVSTNSSAGSILNPECS